MLNPHRKLLVDCYTILNTARVLFRDTESFHSALHYKPITHLIYANQCPMMHHSNVLWARTPNTLRCSLPPNKCTDFFNPLSIDGLSILHQTETSTRYRWLAKFLTAPSLADKCSAAVPAAVCSRAGFHSQRVEVCVCSISSAIDSIECDERY